LLLAAIMREYSESDATIDLHLYNQFKFNGNILENDGTSDIYKLFLSKNHEVLWIQRGFWYISIANYPNVETKYPTN
jgi:hypothetical protein